MDFAHWASRVGAFLVDTTAFVPFFLAGWLIDGPRAGPAGTVGTSSGGVAFWVLVAVGVIVFGYNRWVVAGRAGQSLGKRMFGLCLVRPGTRRPLGMARAFLRDLAHLVDTAICLVGYLFPLWDARRQTLADKIVGSVVVRAA